MSLPKFVTVLGRKYRVVETDMVDTERECVGFTSFPKRIIEIERTLSATHKEEILIHERFHCLLHATGLTEVLSDEVEEAVCSAVELLLRDYVRRKEK